MLIIYKAMEHLPALSSSKELNIFLLTFFTISQIIGIGMLITCSFASAI